MKHTHTRTQKNKNRIILEEGGKRGGCESEGWRTEKKENDDNKVTLRCKDKHEEPSGSKSKRHIKVM